LRRAPARPPQSGGRSESGDTAFLHRSAQRAAAADTRRLCTVLDRESARFGTGARLMADGRIALERATASVLDLSLPEA
jgi:hypothetical protein